MGKCSFHERKDVFSKLMTDIPKRHLMRYLWRNEDLEERKALLEFVNEM